MFLCKNRYLYLTVVSLFQLLTQYAAAQDTLPMQEKAGLAVKKPLYGSNDTTLVPALVLEGEIVGGRNLSELFIWGGNPKDAAKYWAEWTRLRNAVYVTYPYARTAGVVMRDVNKKLENIKGKKERRAYIKSREKELRSAFTDHVTELSVYQGIVLMKLINRETGNNCYEIVKEMKGGFTARFYQTIMFFVGSDLKQGWNPAEEKRDRQIESIVQELDRMYYHYPSTSSVSQPGR